MTLKRWVCACARSFKSRRALLQHMDDKGCPDVPKPEIAPNGSSFDDGEWIPFVDGRKRFAYFECIECDNWWMSGNGFADSWQACQQCESDVFPKWCWKSHSKRHSSKPKKSKSSRRSAVRTVSHWKPLRAVSFCLKTNAMITFLLFIKHKQFKRP